MRQVTARDGTRLAVHERGAGPELLCVPGGPGRAARYLEDLGGLDVGRRLLLLDNRGTGGSDLPADRGSLAFPRLADDLVDVQAAYGLGRVDVLGHSAGCAVALVHAARRPEAVRRLVLLTPSGRPWGLPADDIEPIRQSRRDEDWFPDADEAWSALADAAAGGRMTPAVRTELERATRPFWYGRWDARAQTHAAGADTEMSPRATAGYDPVDGAPGPELLADVRAEVLVVVGVRDALTGAAVGDQLGARLPSATVVQLPGAGHFPWIDEPAALRDVVEGFLAS